MGTYAWVIVLAAAAVALRRAGTHLPPLLVLPTWLLNHPLPFGTLTFASLFLISL